MSALASSAVYTGAGQASPIRETKLLKFRSRQMAQSAQDGSRGEYQPLNWYSVRLTTLLSIMRMYAELYCHLSNLLGASGIQLTIPNDPPKMTDSVAVTLVDRATKMLEHCERNGLTASADSMARMVQIWHEHHDKRKLAFDAMSVATTLQDELARRIVLVIPSSSQLLYSEPTYQWEEVLAKFPQAQDDVVGMNHCRALGQNAGAIFHAMLAVEVGVIALGKLLGVKDHRPGWDATYKTLKNILANGHKRCPRKLKPHFQTIELIGQSLESMKMAWRNKISHADKKLVILTSDFSEQVAEEIITASRGFMRTLATSGML